MGFIAMLQVLKMNERWFRKRHWPDSLECI